MVHTIDTIRDLVHQQQGSRIFYRAANGRRKKEERTGVIKEIYPSLFTVYIESQKSTVSFSYADVLTREVDVQIESTGESLL